MDQPAPEDTKSILDSLGRITKLEDSVRDFINAGRHQVELLKTSDTWNQICSSLDVIGDTTLAVQDYLTTSYPQSEGLKYVYTYGLLQALFIQQDAARHLTEAFDIPYESSERLNKIRELRNSAIGHPTKQSVRKSRHYNYISRISLAKNGFTLLRTTDGSEPEFIDVDVVATVAEQFVEIEKALSSLSSKLAFKDKMHREQFGNDRLVDTFHASVGYLFEKVSQAIHSPSESNVSFGLSMLCSVEKMYLQFEASLLERRELTDYTRYDLDEYKHAILRLKNYLSSNTSQMVESDARIFLFYLREQHKHFVKLAEEIDGEYREA